MTAAIRQLEERIGSFLGIGPNDQYFTPAQHDSDCGVLKTRAVLKQERRLTGSTASSYNKRILTADLREWFGTYITERLIYLHNCYVVKVTDN